VRVTIREVTVGCCTLQYIYKSSGVQNQTLRFFHRKSFVGKVFSLPQLFEDCAKVKPIPKEKERQRVRIRTEREKEEK